MTTKSYTICVTNSDGSELYLNTGLTSTYIKDWLEQQGRPILEDYNRAEGWLIYSVDSYPDCLVNIGS